ncbi:MAG: hypothetical protein CMJ83_22365 [Planctomycetes bacterium]|nr:hypothetical protein [Planctomycetota bacterium]
MNAVLDVKSLVRVFRAGGQEISVLREVSLSVAAKEFVAVMGQSGSGKSSLLHITAGLLPATAGQVFVDGREMTALDERARAEMRRHAIGYVFQNFNLMPQLTAIENVMLPMRINHQDPRKEEARVETLLRHMDLWARRDHSPHQLSGGELQRVSVARALVAEPPLILADEPTGNLATKAGQEVMNLLRSAVDEGGRSVLMVTHNPYDAAKADRVLFLKDGQIDPAWELGRGEVHASAVLDRLKELGI